MSKRIILTDQEVKEIVIALEDMKDQTNLDYRTVRIGQNFYQQLIDKLESKEQTT